MSIPGFASISGFCSMFVDVVIIRKRRLHQLRGFVQAHLREAGRSRKCRVRLCALNKAFTPFSNLKSEISNPANAASPTLKRRQVMTRSKQHPRPEASKPQWKSAESHAAVLRTETLVLAATL
jgi:hypothetical protein